MKVNITDVDVDLGTYEIECDEEAKVKLVALGVWFAMSKQIYNLTDDEVLLACEYYAKDRDDGVYDTWFRGKVQEALESTGPKISHDDAMSQFRERLKAYEAITTMTEYWEEPK